MLGKSLFGKPIQLACVCTPDNCLVKTHGIKGLVPRTKLRELARRELFDSLFDVFDRRHGRYIASSQENLKASRDGTMPEAAKEKRALSQPAQVSGKCLCGTVQFEIDAPARWAWHDHTRASRTAHGAAYATYVGSWRKRFRIT